MKYHHYTHLGSFRCNLRSLPFSEAAALAGCSNPEVVVQSPQLAGCDGQDQNRAVWGWSKCAVTRKLGDFCFAYLKIVV